MAIPNILTIAGSDPSGGAGIQADLKTIAANGAYGMSVITALTAQNTRGVDAVHVVPTGFVKDQMLSIAEDIRVDAIKIGMLANAETVLAVAEGLGRFADIPVVLDPVCVSTSGARLLEPDAIDALKDRLIPLASVLTPNLPEAGELLGAPVPSSIQDMENAADALLRMGSGSVLLKGGHLSGASSCDLLVASNTRSWLRAERIDTQNTHGTGCTLSAAIAAQIPRQGSLLQAVGAAKDYVHGAIVHSGLLSVGHGHGPVNHGWNRN
ncbi:bifunctional hydroxymethylpyrimidine kinase/phosphomethylpyrimidine kinase [Hoeflea poritis]|uniref:hydroxymethylpyrimidine kinase n=1 Tax=Hoeflea poritis TaxID=2993659 RepID=A0ABT4VLP9_9HYPH|nr:bifunctional hydroxymethylpyrimidine kinase/phosphomethylpyrimidine kinase [Hoeflea poritis]MDA4845642.1 bifunctional hydroxymethylpyrimidine kinase/phosphomethylpyrimidine kinase [Hoeflea poritis]